MASVVASGLLNAVAFAGAGFLFSKLNKAGYEEEMRRHNKAMEGLSKANEAWYESQVERRNKLKLLRQEAADASKDMETTNKALHDYRTLKEELDITSKPTIDEYYKPSTEMQDYMNITVGLMGIGCDWLILKVI